MAHFRENPYLHFNFLVDLGDDISIEGSHAGFQEVSGIAIEETGAEDRNVNEKEKSEPKISGLYKSPDVTMKRGVIGLGSFNDWLNQFRKGDHRAIRTVTIHLQNEEHTGVVQTWKLLRARIIKYTSGPMNAKGTDIAIEELGLGVEGIEKVD